MSPPSEPLFAAATAANDRYPSKTVPGTFDNHDRCAGGALRTADGTTVWYAVVADGCGASTLGTEVADRCVVRFREAVAGATAATLRDPEALSAWCAAWGEALQREVDSVGARGGYSTLVGVVAVPAPDGSGDFFLASVNVGDSVAYLYHGPQLAVRSLVPPAPADNPNTHDRGGLVRAIGRPTTLGFPALDCQVVRIPASEKPCFVRVASDGADGSPGSPYMAPFEYKRLFSSGMPFDRLPEWILSRHRAVASARGLRSLDNASVVLLGLGVPPGRFRVRMPNAFRAWWLRRRRPVLIAASVAAFFLILTISLCSGDSESAPSRNGGGGGEGGFEPEASFTNQLDAAERSETNELHQADSVASSRENTTNGVPSVVSDPVADTNADTNKVVSGSSTAPDSRPKDEPEPEPDQGANNEGPKPVEPKTFVPEPRPEPDPALVSAPGTSPNENTTNGVPSVLSDPSADTNADTNKVVSGSSTEPDSGHKDHPEPAPDQGANNDGPSPVESKTFAPEPGPEAAPDPDNPRAPEPEPEPESASKDAPNTDEGRDASLKRPDDDQADDGRAVGASLPSVSESVETSPESKLETPVPETVLEPEAGPTAVETLAPEPEPEEAPAAAPTSPEPEPAPGSEDGADSSPGEPSGTTEMPPVVQPDAGAPGKDPDVQTVIANQGQRVLLVVRYVIQKGDKLGEISSALLKENSDFCNLFFETTDLDEVIDHLRANLFNWKDKSVKRADKEIQPGDKILISRVVPFDRRLDGFLNPTNETGTAWTSRTFPVPSPNND